MSIFNSDHILTMTNFNSKEYWDNRYKKNGNSGPGSYNEFAENKAKIINEFVNKNNIKSIIDYGVGDGNVLKLIDTKNIKYIGIDVSEFIINKCKELFKNDGTKKFILEKDVKNISADLVLSCDVIFHLIEDNIFYDYMKLLFELSKKYVIIYAPNTNDNSKDKAIHVKKREFIKYIFDKYPEYNLVERIKNNVGCPFYIFQNKKTYEEKIPKKIMQCSKKKIDNKIKDAILSKFKDYEYSWFGDKEMIEYMEINKLEEFPNIIEKIKSIKLGQHKADLFRYYYLYINGGVFMDDDLMINSEIDVDKKTFISVKSYHKNKDIFFNGFIMCTKFNPMIYDSLKRLYYMDNYLLESDYHITCKILLDSYNLYKNNQNTLIFQEIKDQNFTEGVKTYDSKGNNILTHYCYTKIVKI